MQLTETSLSGAFVIDLELRHDERGFFARTFDARFFEEHGLDPAVAQCNLSFNHRAGTLRGFHWQDPPAAETKVVRCPTGSVHDVIVDLRAESPTYLEHFAVELSASNRRALYVPRGFAHSYLALTDGAEVAYQVSEYYAPELGRGLRWDDPALGVRWPRPVETVSERDRTWPLVGDRGGLEPARGALRGVPARSGGSGPLTR